MLAAKVKETLVERGPMTMAELVKETGSDEATLRSALISEFYSQQEFDHPKHGRVTAWAVKQSLLRIDDGTYAMPVPKVEPVPEPVPILKPEEGITYVDDTGRRMKVESVTATRITGLLLGHNDGRGPQPYSTDATGFRAIWKAVAS